MGAPFGRPGLLPWDLTSFAGRGAERRKLGEKIAGESDRAQVIGLFGIAGVGKSRLARVLAIEDAVGPLAPHLPGGVLWCAGEIDAIAAALAPPGNEPATERVAAALVRRERTLVIADCPGPAPDGLVEALGTWLSAGSHVFVICARFPIAMRGAARLEIGPLDSDAGARLLIDRCRELDVELGEDDAAALVAAAGGLPLALELCAGALTGESPARLLERLRRDAGDLATDDRDVPDRHRSLEAAFADTWRHLEPRDRAALAVATSFAGAFSRDDFAAVAAAAEPDANLERVVRRGLVTHDGDRFDVLRLVRAMTRAELGPAETARLDRARATAIADRCAGGAIDEAEILAAAAVLAGEGAEHPALARALFELARRARRTSWRTAERALELARRVGGGARVPLADVGAAELARLRGDRAAARAALDAVDPDGAPPPVACAWRRVEALLALDRGDRDGAGARLDEALSLATSALERAEILAARFGIALATSADIDDADGSRAYELFCEAAAPREAAVALVNLGLAALNRGDRQVGLGRLDRAEAVAREAGEGAAIVAVDLFRGLSELADGDVGAAVSAIGRAEKGALDLASQTVWSDAVGYGAVARHLAGVPSARVELASHVDELARRGRSAARALFAAFLARIDDARPAPELDEAVGRPLVSQAVALLNGAAVEPAGLTGRIAARVIDRVSGGGTAETSAVELVVSRDCRQFWAGDAAGDLRRRGPLGRIFEALVETREAGPASLSAEALIDAGWPGESIGAESARTRLYNAVASLRQMGLRGLLVTTGDGYRLEGVAVRRATETT